MPKYIDVDTGNNWLDEGLENYLMYGLEPGGFLTAVLARDLFLAASRADHWNSSRLADIAKIVWHTMPAISIGNYDAVRDWCNDKDGRQSAYSLQKQKEYTWRVLKGEVTEKNEHDYPF